MTRVLFMINGLGLGNSTRCHAVIGELARTGATVEIVTSDNGLWFFSDKPEIARVTEIPSLRYGKKGGRISIASTLAQAPKIMATLHQAGEIIAGCMEQFRPDVVVTDSNYAFGPARRLGVPVAALNNSDMVLHTVFARRDWPASVLPQFLAVECADYLFHRIKADLIISPRLNPADRLEGGKFRRVGPIVRRDCQPSEPQDRPRRVAIMLSGSVFGSPVSLDTAPEGITIDVVGRPPPEGRIVRDGICYHGKVRNSLDVMRAADLVIVNGGFSAVSEALMMRKPMVVIPIPNHAEQWANAQVITDMGIGFMATEAHLIEAVSEGLRRMPALAAAYSTLPSQPNGAVEAARLILELPERKRC
ncbi:MAG: glycosyltransferase [Stygiobacter sp.]|nr:MAG: glycosyltransferase [Stygiobacter sp.]